MILLLLWSLTIEPAIQGVQLPIMVTLLESHSQAIIPKGIMLVWPPFDFSINSFLLHHHAF